MKVNGKENKELIEYKRMSALVDKTYKEVKEIIKKQSQRKNNNFSYLAT